MSAITKIPTNTNFLSPLGFKFNIKRTPGLNYFVQSASIPGISIGVATLGTPFVDLPFTGVKNTYDDLVVTFKVDEELRNYKELFDWMIAISFPDDFTQHQQIVNARPGSGDGIFSDATLTVLSSSKNPIVEVNFKNLFPYNLSELKFSSSETDVSYMEVDVTFKYQSFSFNYLI